MSSKAGDIFKTWGIALGVAGASSLAQPIMFVALRQYDNVALSMPRLVRIPLGILGAFGAIGAVSAPLIIGTGATMSLTKNGDSNTGLTPVVTLNEWERGALIGFGVVMGDALGLIAASRV